MPLTATAVKNAKPGPKQRKMFDGAGLFLLVTPNGGKWWRFKYRFGGKEKLLSLGVYPDVSLKAARDRRDEARKLVADGIDPSEVRQAERAKSNDAFEAVAREWYEKFSRDWSDGHAETVISRLENNVFSMIGNKAISEVNAADVLKVIQRIEKRGAVEVARRTRGICSQVFRYAVVTGRAERDPAADVRGALPPAKRVKHHASVTEPKEIGRLLRTIDGFQGTFTVLCALRFVPYVFVRPGELRKAEWTEFDLDAAEWRIPAEKMKMRQPHIVPLSLQALEIVNSLRELTGADRYLFPSVRTTSRPMSENTINASLRRLGYSKDEMTCHGFRSMASTVLNEQGWNKDVIERQLAHTPQDKVRAAYNYAEHLQERRTMMQAWADYLDALKVGAKVHSLRSVTSA